MRRPFLIDGLGELKPVGSQPEENFGFWKTAIATSFQKTAPPLLFIPFELSLAPQLATRKASLESVLDASLGVGERAICNRQISGRLRVYPTGVGVVRITIALEFRDAIHVSAVAQIARAFEQMLFMDREGHAESCETLLLDVIEKVVTFLFHHQYSLGEARWRPAETIYCFKPFDAREIDTSLNAFVQLLAAAPGNEESTLKLQTTLKQAVRTKNWTLDKVLAAASQRVSLFVICPSLAAAQDRRRNQILEWLTETAELVWVTSYGVQAFIEQLERISHEGLIDEQWLSVPDNAEHLSALLTYTKCIFQAMDSARRDVRSLGAGVLTQAASEIWKRNNCIDENSLSGLLLALIQRLESLQFSGLRAAREDATVIQGIANLIGKSGW